MEKTIREKADEILVKHLFINGQFDNKEAFEHSISTLEHTISVLETIKHQIDEDNYYFLIKEQKAILNELKSRI